jgi:hypothetical protein
MVEAIAAAVALCWPTAPATGQTRPAKGSDRTGARENIWRFSGRWWQPPVYLRQDQPWTERGPR